MMRLSFIFMFILAFSCVKSDLERSIYINDPEHPELPQYSEWGLNTFGAFIGRQPFISNDVEVPARVICKSEKTHFVLSGQKGLGDARYSPYDHSFVMSFVLPDDVSETYNDLVQLHDTTWDLNDADIMVIVSGDVVQDTLEILTGMLQFVRAQLLIVDQEPTEVILSGVFDFRATMNGSPVTVTAGRFDVGINEDNFFKY